MAQACFKRHARLLKGAEFSRVFDKPRRSKDRFFCVLARINQQNRPRLGLAISKKRARRAVARNRIKRIVRESFRQNTSDLISADYVVLATALTEKANNRQLFDSLQQHWQHIKQQCAAS